jgi:hypothetical protein
MDIMREDSKKDQEALVLDAINAVANTQVPEEILSSYTTAFKATSAINILPDRAASLSSTTTIFAHNAYHGPTTGAYIPNQTLSLTELLDLGVRGIELDVYNQQGELRLCHAICTPNGLGFLGYNRKLSDALQEIQAWITKNPSELVMLKFEDAHNIDVRDFDKVLSTHLDVDSIFTREHFGNRMTWPSINELTEQGKRLVLLPQTAQNSRFMFRANHGGEFKASSGSIASFRTDQFIKHQKTGRQFLESWEDRTFIGKLGDAALQIPFLRRFIPHASGETLKTEIAKLKAAGVNHIGLDHISKRDSRFIEATTLADISQNTYFFVPAAVIAGVMMGRYNKNLEELGLASRVLLQGIVATTLPTEGVLLTEAFKTGYITYDKTKTQQQTTARSILAATQEALKTVADSAITLGGSRIIQATKNFATQSGSWFASIGTSILSSMAFRMMYEPTKGAISGIMNGDKIQGFLDGINKSMFGLVELEKPIDTYGYRVRSTARRWDIYLQQNQEIEDTKDTYTKWCQEGTEKFVDRENDKKAQELGRTLRESEKLQTSDCYLLTPYYEDVSAATQELKEIRINTTLAKWNAYKSSTKTPDTEENYKAWTEIETENLILAEHENLAKKLGRPLEKHEEFDKEQCLKMMPSHQNIQQYSVKVKPETPDYDTSKDHKKNLQSFVDLIRKHHRHFYGRN